MFLAQDPAPCHEQTTGSVLLFTDRISEKNYINKNKLIVGTFFMQSIGMLKK